MKINDAQFQEEVVPILVLTIIVCISVIALSIINSITEDKIEDAKQEAIDEMLTEQFPELEESEFDEKNDIYSIFANDTIVGYVFIIEATGYGGPIEILVAIENTSLADDDIILRGISIITNTETPSLGARISEEEFTERFQGANLNEVFLWQDGGSIKQVTAATISSSAVVDAIQEDAIVKVRIILENREQEV